MQTLTQKLRNILISERNNTLRVQAAESGNLEDFNRLFLAEPARLGVRDSKGRAAAHQAAARNKVNILQFIASHEGGKELLNNSTNSIYPLTVIIFFSSLCDASCCFAVEKPLAMDPEILSWQVE